MVLGAVSRQCTVDGGESLGWRAITSDDWSNAVGGGVCSRLLGGVGSQGSKAGQAIVVLGRKWVSVPGCVIWGGGHRRWYVEGGIVIKGIVNQVGVRVVGR